MPQDLFGDVVVRRASHRSRRSSVVVISVVAHAVALVTLMIVPLVATDVLPVPTGISHYFIGQEIIPVVPPPVPRAGHSSGSEKTPITRSEEPPDAAPLEAPHGVTPESAQRTGDGVPGPVGPPVGVGDGLETTTIWRLEAPPSPAQPPAIVHVGGTIRAPQKIADVSPVYPAIAQQARIQGIVIIEATIDARGNVTAARVLRSMPMLDQAALDAVRQWKYTATLLNGVPVPVIMTVTVNFQLQDR